MLAAALRLQGDFSAARDLAQKVARAHPNWAGAQFELGMALGRLGRHAEALDVLRKAEQGGVLPGLWREIGDQLFAMGDAPAADRAYLRHIATPDASISDMMIAVRRDVIKETRDFQTPWEQGSLTERFEFAPSGAKPQQIAEQGVDTAP